MAEQIKEPKTTGQFTEEELKNAQEKITAEKLKIIKDLNKIKYPLSVTVFSHHGTWTIRNETFWQQLKKRDETMIDFMEKFLTEKK